MFGAYFAYTWVRLLLTFAFVLVLADLAKAQGPRRGHHPGLPPCQVDLWGRYIDRVTLALLSRPHYAGLPGMAEAVLPVTYPLAAGVPLVVREASPPRQPRLLDRVRQAIRARHYSRRTEKAYVAWTRRYILLLECARLRVKEIDFARNQIIVREADLRHGAGWVELPWALARKYPNAGREWAWQWSPCSSAP